MFSIGTAANYIKNAVENKDTSEGTVSQIRQFLKVDGRVAITHTPLYKIAIAGLHMLDVEKYAGDDEEVLYFIEIFKNLDN